MKLMSDDELMLSQLSLKVVDKLDIKDLPKGKITRLLVNMVANGIGSPIQLPVMVANGKKPGPVLGITAAIHGNELNGIPIIQRLFQEIKINHLAGSIVAVPVLNIPGFLTNRREFNDGSDLNRLFPGKPIGTCGQIYANRLMERVIMQFEYLIDLHTASSGRANSLYVRADMSEPVMAWMARLQQPQIIVHNHGADGTLRSAAVSRGIAAITVEVGNPQRFQRGLIKSSLSGIHNVLGHLKMLPLNEDVLTEEPVICRRSFWLYTDCGGLLEVYPSVASYVRKNELIARVTNVFGDVIREYRSPEDGIVIGKNTNPVNQTGARILHIGLIGKPKTVFSKRPKNKARRVRGTSRALPRKPRQVKSRPKKS
jgi:predicted deacylase